MQMGWNPVLTHPVLKRIARKAGRSVASVVLSWAVQSDVGVIPSSRNRAHIEESATTKLGFLSKAEMRAIDNLDGSLCRGEPWGCEAERFPEESHDEL